MKCIICNSENHKILFKKEDATYIRCRNCGLIFQNPQPIYSELEKKYDNEKSYWINEKFDLIKNLEAEIKTKDFYVKLIRKEIKLNTEMKILDFGSGIGVFLNRIKPFVKEVKGIDLSEWAVNFGKKRFGIDLQCGNLLEINLPDNYYDIITMWHSIEHLPNPRLYIEKLKLSLKPKGYLIVGSPNVDCFFSKLLGKSWHYFIPNEHIFLFSPDTLMKLLNSSGFIVFGIKKYLYSPETNFSNILGFLKMFGNRGIKNIVNFIKIPINYGPFQTQKWKENPHLLDIPNGGSKDGMIIFSQLER